MDDIVFKVRQLFVEVNISGPCEVILAFQIAE